jgi:ribonuclease HII
MIVGIDEVGRGAWAGPLVVGAVVLGGADIPGLTDSKKLSAKSRQKYTGLIKEQALGIGLGWVSAENIDKHGLGKSLSLATQLAMNEIIVPYTQIIIDGTVKFIDDPRVSVMKQADLLVPSVSAASIIAKVARDYYMSTLAHDEFPEYGFGRHVGYGTAAHLQALQNYGVTRLHRHSFRPIKELLGQNPISDNKKPKDTPLGRQAENTAAIFLKAKGYSILNQNWRTKWCEIDVIAQKDGIVYFIEVKHRAKPTHGDGLDAITKKKYSQMKFAAELWRKKFKRSGDARLSVVATAGNPPQVTKWVDTIIL